MNGLGDLQRLARDLDMEADAIVPRVEKAVGNATEDLYRTARASAPRETGELLESIQRDTEGTSRRVWSDAKQGFFQEYGTADHGPQEWLMVHADSAQARLGRELLRALWTGK